MRRTLSILGLVLFGTALGITTVGCKHKPTAAEEEEEADRQKEEKKLKKDLEKRYQQIAGMAAVVAAAKSPDPKAKTGAHLQMSGKTGSDPTNYDVLYDTQLADPSSSPTARLDWNTHPLETCKSSLDMSTGGSLGPACATVKSLEYLVVLKPRRYDRPDVSGTTYTAGSLTADAFVFDLKTGKLLGGAPISATSPDAGTMHESSASIARSRLDTELGKAITSSIQDALGVASR